LQIAFSTEEIRDLCLVEISAIERLGKDAAAALKNRLSDIRAAEFPKDLIAGNPRTALINGRDSYLIDLADNFVLTLVCNQVNPKLNSDGHLNWDRVRRVKVVSVEVM
jgi:hypothetical protein